MRSIGVASVAPIFILGKNRKMFHQMHDDWEFPVSHSTSGHTSRLLKTDGISTRKKFFHMEGIRRDLSNSFPQILDANQGFYGLLKYHGISTGEFTQENFCPEEGIRRILQNCLP